MSRLPFGNAKRCVPDQVTDQEDQLTLALGDNGRWGLTLADKATAQAQASDHEYQRKCNFFHLSPLSEVWELPGQSEHLQPRSS